MKPRVSNQKAAALTLVEVLVVAIVLVVIVAILLPALASTNRKSSRLGCVNNLKQISLAFRLWEGDNGDKYPMSVSVTNGGTMELAAGTNAWFSFLVMSNQLSTPKVLHCPEDTNRFAANNFSAGVNHRNISYFVGVDSSESDPQALMSGDDNFVIDGEPVKPGLLSVTSNTTMAWDSTRHIAFNSHFWTAARNKYIGNLGLADGSAWQWNTDGLRKAVHQTGLATNRLAIP
jgi:competence protein ComGC